jgi:flagellar FliL protein
MAPEAEEHQKQPKSSKKLLLIVLPVVVLLLAGGGTAAYFKFFNQSVAAGGHAAEEKKHPEVVMQDMETFLVNLADPGSKRFLKVTMKAKLDSMQLSEEFKSRLFELRDSILMILTSKTSEEVASPEDKLTLKREILTALNKSLHKGQVQDIYFTEFLIQ